MTEEFKIKREINLKGEVCPYTLVESKLALEELKKGEILRIITDYLPAVKDLTRSLAEGGQTILNAEPLNETDWQILVKKEMES